MLNDSAGEGLLPDLPEFVGAELRVDVPVEPGILQDGRPALIVGAALRDGDLAALNDASGAATSAGVRLIAFQLHRLDVRIRAVDLADYARAHGLCQPAVDARFPDTVTLDMLVRLLADHAAPAHIERGASLEDLAQLVENQRQVIIAANTGIVWAMPVETSVSEPSHLLAITRVARAPAGRHILGLFVLDPTRPAAEHFLDAVTLQAAWLDTGSWCLVIDLVNLPFPTV